MTISNFGAVLKDMRKKAGMSQEEIAHELHMSISNISRLETGKYEAKIADAWRWANATGSQDVLLAFLCSVDISIVQQILDSSTVIINTISGGIF